MASKADALIRQLSAQLAPLGAFRARAMFGGHGLYLDDIFFGIIGWDRFYLKVDDGNRADFQAAGSEPFTYVSGEGRTITMSYWTCPDKVLKSPEQLQSWVEQSVAAAKRAKANKPKRKSRSKSRSDNPFL